MPCNRSICGIILGMKQDFHILALSGGGFRGLFTARVLAGLEKAAGKPIGRCFDLICGTSIGGMIALGLGIEKSAEEMADAICEHGPSIFSGNRLPWKYMLGLKYFRAKHSNKHLQKVANTIFGGQKLGDSRHRILVPVVNHSTGNPRMFKTWWDNKGSGLRMADAIMAATAAPGYFPIWITPDKDRVAYLDGGLYANAPGILGVHEAVFHLDCDIKSVSLLSIGTMREDFGMSNFNKLALGSLAWGESLFDVVASAQDNLAHYMLDQQLGDCYHRIEKQPTPEQSKKLGLDIATKEAIHILSSAAQSAVQNFKIPENREKWLEHVPASNLHKGD